MTVDDYVTGVGVTVAVVDLNSPHVVDLDVDHLEAGRLMPVPVVKLPPKWLSRPYRVNGRFIAQQYE